MIILIGNKADLEAQRDVTYEEAKQFAEENGETLARSDKRSAADGDSLISLISLISASCFSGLLFLEASAKT